MHRHAARPRAFTLTEMLMVIALIAVLIAFLIPVTGKAREQARRVQCASNVRQICLAAIHHAQDDERGIYIPNPPGNNDVDDFNPLYPKYLKDIRVFVCPSTMNQVRGPSDLTNNAVGGANGLYGHSYEIRNWADAGTVWPDGMVFAVQTAKNFRQFRHSSTGALIMDADDATEGDTNNWPDISDNHGAAGLNCGYMDAHVEFVPPGRRLLEAFLEGYYNPGLPDSIYSRYGVSHSGNTFKYVN
jgi:prepilin-type N-terminal cleavage/methylation domain-containing protein